MRWPWKLLHNVVAHPLLFMAGLVRMGEASATTFHDWTADRAWPAPTDEEERRLAVWERLREAEEAAEGAGFEALADSLGTLATLWAAGFEDRAAEALNRAAAPLLAGLADESLDECPAGRRCCAMTARVVLLVLALVNAGASFVNAGGPETYKRGAWRDDDHDCQNTRVEIFMRSCREVKLSPSGCKVLQATCLDLYSGAEVGSNSPAQAFHVDHLFPAAEAWKRRSWTPEAWADFWNDQRNLVLTRARNNLRKNDAMPDRWCPAERGARILAARRFRRIARAYGLALLPAEERGLQAWEAGSCAPSARLLSEEVAR